MTEHDGSPTRREVLRAGAAGIAALLAGASVPADAQVRRPAPKGPYWPFKVGFQSYSLRHFSLDDALDKTHKMGIHYWEAFQAHIPQTNDPARIKEYLDKLSSYNIRLMAWGVEYFGPNEASARKTFQFAKAMKLQEISADFPPESGPMLDRLAEEFKINVGIHNHGPGARYTTIASLQKALEGRSPRIGICLDTGHLMRSGGDPVEALKVFGKRIHGVHIKDALPNGTPTEIGKGALRTVDFFRVLRRLKYDGIVALEYEEHENDPVPYMDECLAALRDAIQKANNQP